MASGAPYCVGTKNGFVVTWLTNTNLYSGCDPNTLEEPLLLLALLVELEPQAREQRRRRAGGESGQRGPLQERAAVEARPLPQLPAPVRETLLCSVGLSGVRHVRLLLLERVPVGEAASCPDASWPYLLSREDVSQPQFSRKLRTPVTAICIRANGIA